MIGNKPVYNDIIQWAYDYNVMSWDAVNYIETYTYKIGGVYSATGTYTGGTTVGYVYVKYTDATKTVFVNSYGKKA